MLTDTRGNKEGTASLVTYGDSSTGLVPVEESPLFSFQQVTVLCGIVESVIT